jgi:hypothetical protein
MMEIKIKIMNNRIIKQHGRIFLMINIHRNDLKFILNIFSIICLKKLIFLFKLIFKNQNCIDLYKQFYKYKDILFDFLNK